MDRRVRVFLTLLPIALAATGISPVDAQEGEESRAVQAEGDPQEDLPLTVENVIAEQGGFRVETTLEYVSIETRDSDTAFRTLSLGSRRFVSVPVAVDSGREITDTVIGSTNLTYGVTGDLEFRAEVSGLVEQSRRTTVVGDTQTESDARFNEFQIGVNYRFSRDAETPALLGFADISLVENNVTSARELSYARSGTLGLTTYRTIDPIVLTLTGGYRFAASRDVGDQRVDPGDVAYVNPRIAFAVNEPVTLTGGARVRWQDATTIDGETQGIDDTDIRLQAGVSYKATDAWTLRLRTEAGAGGDTEAEVGLTSIYDF